MNKAAGAAAVVFLGVALMLAAARITVAAPPCGHRSCSDEVAQSGLTGRDRAACFKAVIAECKAGGCSCGESHTVLGDCACSPSGAFLDLE